MSHHNAITNAWLLRLERTVDVICKSPRLDAEKVKGIIAEIPELVRTIREQDKQLQAVVLEVGDVVRSSVSVEGVGSEFTATVIAVFTANNCQRYCVIEGNKQGIDFIAVTLASDLRRVR